MCDLDVTRDLGVTFELYPSRIFSSTTFEIYFCCYKATQNVATDYYIYFYLIVLSSLTAILQINQLALHIFSF